MAARCHACSAPIAADDTSAIRSTACDSCDIGALHAECYARLEKRGLQMITAVGSRYNTDARNLDARLFSSLRKEMWQPEHAKTLHGLCACSCGGAFRFGAQRRSDAAAEGASGSGSKRACAREEASAAREAVELEELARERATRAAARALKLEQARVWHARTCTPWPFRASVRSPPTSSGAHPGAASPCAFRAPCTTRSLANDTLPCTD